MTHVREITGGIACDVSNCVNSPSSSIFDFNFKKEIAEAVERRESTENKLQL